MARESSPCRGYLLSSPLIEPSLRSTLTLALLFLTAGTAAVAVGAGCSDATSFFDADSGATPTAANGGDDAFAYADGGASLAPSTVSRLCTKTTECLPDDDGTFTLSTGTICATPVDGGTVPPVHDNGCRIIADVGPHCYNDGGTDRNGIDGVACSTGNDCAPGFDCVLGTGNRSAVCRRYCCSGSSACDDHLSQNGGKTFCDIQSLAESSTLVPVCMPIKLCTLLKPKECTSSETCAIVTDKGDTGCVAVGPKKETESCDEAHCADGLTCLGSVGARTCYRLCRIEDGVADTCTSGKCTTGSLFPDTTYGVCQ